MQLFFPIRTSFRNSQIFFVVCFLFVIYACLLSYLRSEVPKTEIPNKFKKNVHIYYTNIPDTLRVYANASTIQYFHFIQSVDTDSLVAKRAFNQAQSMLKSDPTSLMTTHVKAWEDIWSHNGFSMISDKEYLDNDRNEAFKMAQQLYSSFYNLYASIPYSFENQFHGLSTSGLAYGGLRWDYFNQSSQASLLHQNSHKSEGNAGHVTYHQEFWVLPLISMFSPEMSKNLINTRLRKNSMNNHMSVFAEAVERAQDNNLRGVQFPSEQGEYGIEVSPFKDASKKIHITADISYGLRCFLRMSHSSEFLQQAVASEVSLKGEEYIYEFAKYWASRMRYDGVKNRFVIEGVSFGERPQTKEVNNEAFTNYMALLSLDTYKYALTLSKKNPYDNQYAHVMKDYDEKMNYMHIPYDELRQLILEYDTYVNGHRNEETWVPFLNFPIQKQMTYAQKKSIYDHYAPSLNDNGADMLAYGSFLVGYLELNEEQKANEYMKKASSHFSEPFHVLSEYPNSNLDYNRNNNYNYLPGYASFIQSFIAGYCGMRVRDYQLDFIYPSDHFDSYQTPISSFKKNSILKAPVDEVQTWNITGLAYLGNELDILYDLPGKLIMVRNREPIGSNVQGKDKVEPLEIVTYQGYEVVTTPLRVGQSITLRLDTELWKYSPKRNSLKRLHRSTGYSDNINILASIYAADKYQFIDRPSGTPTLTVSWSIITSAFIFMKVFPHVLF